jgi:hypothetical protein
MRVRGTAGEILVMLGFCPKHEPEPEPGRDIEAEFRLAVQKIKELSRARRMRR